jgi:hypothetical protein
MMIYVIHVNDKITLSNELLPKLSLRAESFSLPKNKLIEFVLKQYLDNREKAEYIASFKIAAREEDVLIMVEEGLN